MISIRSLHLALVFAAGAFVASSFAVEPAPQPDQVASANEHGQLVPVTDQTDAQWLAKARADYPLESCVVSEDKFDEDSMGGPKEFIYRHPGQPDRLIRFCCKDCVKDFNKEPAKYLKALDDAAAKKAKKQS